MTEDFYFVRPATGQRLAVGTRRLPDPRADIFTSPPKLGLVISTYAGAPFVELSLAVRQRLYPDIPALVHDDASPQGDQLQAVCDRYHAEFETNSSRLGHQMGDLSAIVGGLRWAEERGIDLLVKMSRRFVPLINWAPGLAELAFVSQFPTYSNVCFNYRMPIRSECVGFSVRDWLAPDAGGEIARFMLSNLIAIIAENYLIDYAQKLRARMCDTARKWEASTPSSRLKPGFAIWDFIASNRIERCPSQLWHNASRPDDYASVARSLGLPYGPESFTCRTDN